MIRSAERYDLVKIKLMDSAYDSVAYDLVETELSEAQAERRHSEGVRTSTVIGLFFRFCLRIRQSSFHWIRSDRVISGIGRKWKRSDSSDSNSVEFITPIFDFH